MHHLKKQKGAYLKTFLFSIFVLVFFVSQTNVALAIYQQLQQITPMDVSIDSVTLDNGSTANNTVTLSGTVRGAEYQYQFDCNDPNGAFMGSGFGHIENGATYAGGLTTQSLNTVITGTGVTGGNCNGGFSPEDDDEARYLYTFSGTLDVSNASIYPDGPASVTVTYSTPGVHGSGNNEPAYTVSDTINFTVSHGATVTVNKGSCPSNTNWTSSTGATGTGDGSFTVATTQSGTSVSMSATPPAGWIFTGATPSSQMVFPNGTYNFDLGCVGEQVPIVTLSADTNSLSCSQTATLTWTSQYATSCSAPWTSSTNTSGSQNGIGVGSYTITCVGPGGSKTSNPVVDIAPAGGSCPSAPPTVTVTANPTSITSGNSSLVSWSSSGATSCATDWWSSSTALTGSISKSPAVTTTYTKICSNSAGSNSASATVTVTPSTAATISVINNTGGTWVINPGNLSGSGSGSVQVNPGSGNTYTITPGNVNGYYYPPTVTNSVGFGSSMYITAGQSESFNLAYDDDGTGNGNGNNFDYSLSNSGNTTVTKAGINVPGQNTITKNLLHVPAQGVDLSLSIGGNNTGISYAIANSSCSPTCNSTINFTIAPNATVGTHLVTVTGTPKSHTTSFNLIINPSLTIDVTCTATPNSALVGNPVVWNSTVLGTTGTSTYRWTGTGIPTSPAPATPSFSIPYSTVGLKTATLTVTDSVGNTGTCNPPGQAQINFNPKFQEI